MSLVVSCRGVILHEGKMLASHQGGIYCTPGGRLDPNETTEECILRELKEELHVEGKNPKLIGIMELLKGEDTRVDFFYLIENGSDFVDFDLDSASHGHEVHGMERIDVTNPEHKVLPTQIVDIVKNQDFDRITKWVERIN